MRIAVGKDQTGAPVAAAGPSGPAAGPQKAPEPIPKPAGLYIASYGYCSLIVKHLRLLGLQAVAPVHTCPVGPRPALVRQSRPGPPPPPPSFKPPFTARAIQCDAAE